MEQNYSDPVHEFSQIDISLVTEFVASLTAIRSALDKTALNRWLDQTLQHARNFTEAPQVTRTWLQVSPDLQSSVGTERLMHWSDLYSRLSHKSPLLALAFGRASLDVLPLLTPAQTEYWANMGLRLAAGGWKSTGLAQRLFEQSATFIKQVATADLDRLVSILITIASHSVELATACLTHARQALETLPDNYHQPLLELAGVISDRTWSDSLLYFEQGPEMLQVFDLSGSARFSELIISVILASDQQPFLVLTELADGLRELTPDRLLAIEQQATRISRIDATATLAFLKAAPAVSKRSVTLDLADWVDKAISIEKNKSDSVEPTDRSGLVAYFNLDTHYSIQTIDGLSGRVDFENSGSLLRMFTKALAGEDAAVQPRRELQRRRLGWLDSQKATTDGKTIYVPEYIDRFPSFEANLDAYKVSIAHQSGRIHCGSFGYQANKPGRFSSAGSLHWQQTAESDHLEESTGTPMQHYFDQFKSRNLISILFGIIEDCRVDRFIQQEYPGLVRSNRHMKAHELRARPMLERLRIRSSFLENLLTASWDHTNHLYWPDSLHSILASAIAVLQLAGKQGANVQDSAHIASWLYDLAIRVPNVPPGNVRGHWRQMPADLIDSLEYLPDSQPELPANVFPMNMAPVSISFKTPDFSGDLKPELVQTLDALSDHMDMDELTEQQLQELLDNSVEIEDADISAETIIQQLADEEEAEEGTVIQVALTDLPEDEPLEIDEGEDIQWSSYDEWDFRANDYLKHWCDVGERPIEEGDDAFYEETLREHHGLVLDIRRQFELLRPESHRKIRNLVDGHDIDLDQAIQFRIDKKAGVGPRARFYSRRDKMERNVAVAFLLDMSGSTDEVVDSQDIEIQTDSRIIDLERQATVLVVEALESIGDSYGIYGFSGYGRKNVSFHIIKNLDEQIDDRVRRRIDGIKPMRSTRMGAAIRHASAKLDDHPAKIKILMMISDGRPQDQSYGQSRDDQDYALHDTHQALVDCRQLGIEPFLITVDRQGEDYLAELCGDIGYEVINDIASLPSRLPSIYRHIATGS